MKQKLDLIPIEVKFFDTVVDFQFDATLEVPATGQWALIPQGDTQSTRDGRLARIKSIHFRGVASGSSAAVGQIGLYLWVVLDRQCNGAAAAATDVMTGVDASVCMLNLNNSKRFKILKKVLIAPNQVGYSTEASGAGDVLLWPVEFNIPCDILMDWNSTTGAITEITQNNIFILVGSTSGGSGSDDKFALDGTARLRFIG